MRRVVSGAALVATAYGSACGGRSVATHGVGAAGEAPTGGRAGSHGGRGSPAGTTVGSVAGAGGSSGRFSVGGAGPFWHVRTDRMNDPFTHFHEAAHGWFGNGVRLRCWGELALSEGTASYLASRALEAVGNVADAAKMWLTYEAWADDRRYSSQVPAWSSACEAYDHDADNFQTYTRGALFLRALEQRIGRETLDEALRAFYTAFVGTAAGIDDLLATVAATSGYDPRSCAGQWLQQNPLPRFVPCE